MTATIMWLGVLMASDHYPIMGNDTMMHTIIMEVMEEDITKSDDVIYVWSINGGSVDISLISR